MSLSFEWQRNICIMTMIQSDKKMCHFQTNVSYSVPLKILLDYFEGELEHKYVPMGRGLRAPQPSLPARAAAHTPSRMPGEQSHSCTAFPSTLWLHPGLTFAQKIQNIWISSSTLYALFFIQILPSPLYSLLTWGNHMMQLQWPRCLKWRG